MTTDTGIDSARILREQYKDGSNLSARIRLHQRFSTNRYGFFRWMFDRIQIPESARVLELGCGTGILWRGSAQVPRMARDSHRHVHWDAARGARQSRAT